MIAGWAECLGFHAVGLDKWPVVNSTKVSGNPIFNHPWEGHRLSKPYHNQQISPH